MAFFPGSELRVNDVFTKLGLHFVEPLLETVFSSMPIVDCATYDAGNTLTMTPKLLLHFGYLSLTSKVLYKLKCRTLHPS